jgi:predicted nucleic acid-binding protein
MDAIFGESDACCTISRLGLVEAVSAFSSKVRTGELDIFHFTRARQFLHGDIRRRTLLVVRMLNDHFREAEQLLLRHAHTRRLRALDALQLATALDLWWKGRVDTFVSADQLLGEVAVLEGIPFLNPALV